MPRFTGDELRDVSARILRALGVSEGDAELVSRLLVEANLRGVDSHGVMRLPEYAELIRQGAIKLGTKIEVVRDSPTTALINGNWGLGQIIGTRAMEIAVAKARSSGMGSVGIFNCNHIGTLAHYAMMALDYDMIGFVACNSAPGVVPYGGTSPELGTNPFAFAIPAGEEKPVVLDIATSIVAEGKVRLKMKRGESIPPGWIVDSKGNPSTDPAALYAGGALLPFGEYKGYGLGLVVDILSGALTEAGCGHNLRGIATQGVFMMALDVGSFTSVEAFKERVDNLIRAVRSSPKASGSLGVFVPGELEFKEEERRRREGLFIEDETWRSIRKLMDEPDIPPNSFVKG